MDTKEKLMIEALELFAARGFDAVGIQDIVKNCNVTKPTLYHHFKNKLGLLESILDLKFAPLLIQVKNAAPFNPTHDFYQGLYKNLTEITEIFFEYAEKEPTFYRLLLTLFNTPPENKIHKISNQKYIDIYKILESLFLEAAGVFGNMKGKERIATTTFIGMINGFILLILNKEVQISKSLITTLVHQFMYGIAS